MKQLVEKLRKAGVRTFCTDDVNREKREESGVSILNDDIQANVEKAFGAVLDALLLDWRRDPNMKDTPKRVAKMYVKEIFRGRYEEKPELTSFDNEREIDQLYVVGPVDVKSTCAHHLLPFVGKAYIGVLPSKDHKIIGLSKFNRVVDHYARRPSIQETLTNDIADFLDHELQPRGLAVMITSAHFCVYCRGVEQSTNTTTCEVRGQLSEPVTKAEFFELVKQNQRTIF